MKRNHLKLEMKIKKLHPDATIPMYQSEGASGLDLTSCENVVLRPGERKLVSTGIAIQLPDNHEGQVRPRSGLSLKHGITVLNSPGTIDNDYTGPCNIVLFNSSQTDFQISVGDRIAQLVVMPVSKVRCVMVENLDETARGANGFGSTGRR
jgi:dUTP pyrophosphatase